MIVPQVLFLQSLVHNSQFHKPPAASLNDHNLRLHETSNFFSRLKAAPTSLQIGGIFRIL